MRLRILFQGGRTFNESGYGENSHRHTWRTTGEGSFASIRGPGGPSNKGFGERLDRGQRTRVSCCLCLHHHSSYNKPETDRLYHVLPVVLVGDDRDVFFDSS